MPLPQKIPAISLHLHIPRKGDTYGHIRVHVTIPGEKAPARQSLGHKVPIQHWDRVNEIVKRPYPDADEINDRCRIYMQRLQETLKEEYKNGTLFTKDVIYGILNPAHQSTNFKHYYLQRLNYIRSRWSSNYGRVANTSYQAFCSFAPDLVPFRNITADLLREYESWLRAGDKATKRKALSRNTIYLRMRHIKEIINDAIDNGHISPKQIKTYKFPQYKDVDKDYLTLSQTETIWNALNDGDFNHNEPVRVTAAFFLIECYAGLRVSDWKRFSTETIISTEALKVRARKNNQPVYLYFDKFTRLEKVVRYIEDNQLEYNIADQTANKMLKIVAAHCHINKRVTTHTGRHTFGTMLAVLGYTTKEVADHMGISEETAKKYSKNTGQSSRAAQERHGGL